MRLAHNKDVDKEFTEVIAEYLLKFNGKNINVYGDNNISKWLCDNHNYDYYCDGNNCDIIIVTDFANFAQIKADMKNKVNAEIISIVDLPEGCQ